MKSTRKTLHALLLFAVTLFSCESQPTIPEIEAKIISLAKERSKAVVKSDTTTMSRILSKDFTYINIWGERLTRQQYLTNNASLGEGSYWISQDMDSISVKASQSFAVISFRVNDRFNYQGAFQSNFCRSTFVYELQGDDWKCVMGHTTKIE
jgi:Domain of unknown function (DUF4440)